VNNLQIEIKNKLEEGLTFKVSRFKEKIKRTRPHTHDEYYELIFLEEGEGFHSIEDEKFVVSTPEFYFLKPGQLHFWQFTSVPKGFVVLFMESEFDPIKEAGLISLYRDLSVNMRIGLLSGTYPGNILQEIFNEYQVNSGYSRTIIHGLLKALIGKLLQITEKEKKKPEKPVSMFDRFQRLLANECPRLHKVNEFADLLHTTPQNLNAICRKQMNKTASELINERILLEAKRNILHTDSTINEIAELMNFNDPSHFVKFFRKSEGLTPLQFRAKYFQ
jgi:AraC-like DNA-binding protein/quercetin dioxygenase-like cupin family protein